MLIRFQRFFGDLNPLIAIFSVVLLGFFLLSYLLSKGWFAIYTKGNLKGLVYSSGLAALYGFIVILVDFYTRFYPADINIVFPESLLFYPVMGFVAEILFQVLPLTVMLFMLTALSKKVQTLWIGILVAALFEPTFQVMSLVSGQFPLWFVIGEFMRIFVVIFSQLALFKRYDFVTMYWFRIVYYTFWHIVWGYLRLELLF